MWIAVLMRKGITFYCALFISLVDPLTNTPFLYHRAVGIAHTFLNLQMNAHDIQCVCILYTICVCYNVCVCYNMYIHCIQYMRVTMCMYIQCVCYNMYIHCIQCVCTLYNVCVTMCVYYNMYLHYIQCACTLNIKCMCYYVCVICLRIILKCTSIKIC